METNKKYNARTVPSTKAQAPLNMSTHSCPGPVPVRTPPSRSSRILPECPIYEDSILALPQVYRKLVLRKTAFSIGLTFQSSSNLLICWAVICRARSCSCSEGILTSQERKQRSWIRGCHCELSQLMSLRLL